MTRLPRLFKKDCPQYLIQRDNFHQAFSFLMKMTQSL